MVRRVLVLALVVGACGDPPVDGGDPVDAARPGPDAPAPDARDPAFAVQYVDPDHGPFRGGTELTVRGNGFADDVEVWIGGRRVLTQEVIDERRIVVVTPAGAPGAADVEVRRPSGEVAVDPGGFTYDAIAIDPPSGSLAGNTLVTLTGFETDFAPGTTVTLDGLPLTGVSILDPERITGYTPPGAAVGDADLRVTTATTVHELERAFTYFTTGDPFAGGMSGGAIDGELNVVVLDNWTKDGLPGAYVVVGDPATSPHQGRTDALGQITFSGADLVGPVTVAATKEGFEVATFHCFDAENLTIFLRSPPPPPSGGPGSVGPSDGVIRGHVMFGNTTGLGSPFWHLVPAPRTPTEVKRIYVTTSAPSMFSTPRPPVAPIDYAYEPDRLAWEFEVRSRPGAYAVVAVAGLYDPARDPEGNGVTGFEPFALGVTRGVLVGPGEDVANVDVVVDIPLDAAAHVRLVDPPPLATPGWTGPLAYAVRAFVELGGDGAIMFGRHGLPLVASEPPPGELALAPGDTDVLVTDAPPRYGALGDATYTFQASATTGGASPFSIRIERGVPALGALALGDWVGVPRPLDPAPGAQATARRVLFAPEGAATRAPTFHLHLLSEQATGAPVWRGVTCGSLYDVPLPDLTPAGFAWPPSGADLVWTRWSAHVVGGDYDQFNYRWMGATYWDAYAADASYASFP